MKELVKQLIIQNQLDKYNREKIIKINLNKKKLRFIQ